MPRSTVFFALLGMVTLSACEKGGQHTFAHRDRESALTGLCTLDGVESVEITTVRPNDWFVLAGSFVHTFDTGICDEWTRLTEAGYSPKLGWSDAFPSFRPGWIVLVEGPLRPDSARVLADSMRTLVPVAHPWPGW